MPPDWRNSHLVLRDDSGEKLNPRDFGLQAGDKIKSAYVLAHPEMPWPQWIVSQAQKAAPERKDSPVLADCGQLDDLLHVEPDGSVTAKTGLPPFRKETWS